MMSRRRLAKATAKISIAYDVLVQELFLTVYLLAGLCMGLGVVLAVWTHAAWGSVVVLGAAFVAFVYRRHRMVPRP